MERMDIALQRIAQEAEEKTGELNLRNLGLTRLPDELFALGHLQRLALGCSFEEYVYSNQRNPNQLAHELARLHALPLLQHLSICYIECDSLQFVAGLTTLQSLDCSDTQIKDLSPLVGLSMLQSLSCSDTQIKDLNPLRSLSTLQSLDCSRTHIEDLGPLADLATLQSLDCNRTQIRDLDSLAGLTVLQSLNCSYTHIQDLIPLAGLSALRSLDCRGTEIQDLSPLSGLTALQSLNCCDTTIQDLIPLASLSALRSLDCSATPIQDLIPLAGLRALQLLDCGNTRIQDLSPLADLTALQSLECSVTKIQSLSPLAGLTALQSLACSFTDIQDPSSLANLSALQSLDCCGTPIQDLSPLAGLTALQSLYCRDTQIQDLSPIKGLTALQLLDCCATKIQDLSPLTGLTALQSLYCRDTPIQDLSPLAGLSALQLLDCRNTQIQDLSPLAGLSALQLLDCCDTQVQDLSPLAGLSALQSLDCRGTRVRDLSPLVGLSALQSLDCRDTRAQDLSPLAGLSALRSLDCSNTPIQDLSPLVGLTALRKLNCNYCQLNPVPNEFWFKPSLKRLFLYRTTIVNLPQELLSKNAGNSCLSLIRTHILDLEKKVMCTNFVDKQNQTKIHNMQTELIQAIQQGDLAKIKQLVEAGANIHYRDDYCYNAFCNALSGANQNLLGTLKLLMEYGVNWSEALPFYQSILDDLSRMGCFEVIKLLIEVGIDERPLQWSPLIKATALGSLQNMQYVLQQQPDLEQHDYWRRTAWLVSLLTGDIEKAKLLQQHGCKTDVRGHCGQPPLFYAIRAHAPAMLQWLISQGQDVAQEDDRSGTCLVEAVNYNDLECVKILLTAGVDVDKDACGGPALHKARDAAIIRLLLEAGADPRNLSYQGQRALLSYPAINLHDELNIETTDFEQYHTRIFAKRNPELMNNPFWLSMIEAGCGAYRPRDMFDDCDVDHQKPVWCASRAGQSLTFLPDGRAIQIGGEHEDYYDPDFCIYNDVFVHHPDGKVDIYGYPADIFSPTDFHTATLSDDFIYIIGGLGYSEQRRFGFTPVYRLNIHTLVIEPLDTHGEMPGWISEHRASLLSTYEIRVWGGGIYQNSQDAPVNNDMSFVLDLARLSWTILT